MAVKEYPIIWLEGASCTGCFVSVLNSDKVIMRDFLFKPLVEDSQISLALQFVIMAQGGERAIQYAETIAKKTKNKYILIVEGAIPTKDDGLYCRIGEDHDGTPVPMNQVFEQFSHDAMVVIAIGTCAAFGGIPARAPHNPSNCVSVSQYLKSNHIDTPHINLPGCPCHPQWFMDTVKSILAKGLPSSDELDELNRPLALYGNRVHDYCERTDDYRHGVFAKHMGDKGCLRNLGCRGLQTYASCPQTKWNGETSWCVEVGTPCIGCAHEGFPDVPSPQPYPWEH